MKADEKAAVEWFVKAAALGDHRAMINLGWCHSAGIGVAKDAKEDAKWYGKAADGGPDGLDDLLWFYSNGIGSGKDEKGARQSVREALASGNEKARAALKTLGSDEK